MSTPKLFAQTLPSLARFAPRRAPAPIARHVRHYTKPAGPALPAPVTLSQSRPAPPMRRHLCPAPTQRRPFSASPAVSHGHVDPPKPGEELYVTFIDKEGAEHKLAVSKGDNLLDIAQAHDLEMEGACGGSCACSTCHVIVLEQEFYDRMPEPDDDENDMLDLAFGLQETSRLGCQVVMTPELDGLRVKLPSMTRNLQSSDFK
ncbi:2Fe-2S ferredoxin-type domain-containing protein [Staphylotrichum tortipilum]|uniref:2Fe-2S ferredoxin-type domain-containing protein n=1 Tax=Staphylotrichum tortipilum TaxID=2831512 RepID=A0AAN6MAH7_9PEZI|nr:2Fe-2S ferredoxin-type domain-containing protein [Staphylotrichum longicolle]